MLRNLMKRCEPAANSIEQLIEKKNGGGALKLLPMKANRLGIVWKLFRHGSQIGEKVHRSCSGINAIRVETSVELG